MTWFCWLCHSAGLVWEFDGWKPHGICQTDHATLRVHPRTKRICEVTWFLYCLFNLSCGGWKAAEWVDPRNEICHCIAWVFFGKTELLYQWKLSPHPGSGSCSTGGLPAVISWSWSYSCTDLNVWAMLLDIFSSVYFSFLTSSQAFWCVLLCLTEDILHNSH